MRLLLLVVFLCTAPIFAQDVVVNKYYRGGSQQPDIVELLVIHDGFTLSGYQLRDFGISADTLLTAAVQQGTGNFRFTNVAAWQGIRAGTLIVLPLTNDSLQRKHDTVLTVGLNNPTYFAKSGNFNIASRDMIMIKRPDADIAGTEGNVHALSTALPLSSKVFGISPHLAIAEELSTAKPFAVPNHTRGDTTDYRGNRGTTAAALTFGLANNPANQRFLDSLRKVRTAVQDERQAEISRVVIAPQPTSSECTVNFRLDAANRVSIALVDMLGNRREMYSRNHVAGEQSIRLSLSDVAVGTYFVVMKAGNAEWRERVQIMR